MPYTVAVTSAGQMTIPKVLRDKFGIKSSVLVDEDHGTITVTRQKSPAEELKDAFAKIDALWTAEEKVRNQQLAGTTYKDAVNDLEKTPAGRKAIEAEYGEGIYE